jgi:enoyl-CoA hydratase
LEENLVLYEQRGPIGILTMNRAKQMNALSQPMVTELQERIAVLQEDDSVRVIILTGSDKAFSAGYDLKETRNNPVKGPVAWRKRLTNDVNLSMAIWDCTKPVIAAVNGYCLGGGCDLALICDLTIAGESARFGEPEIRFGSGVVTLIMPWVLGMKKTREFLYTGHDGLSARHALELGLINRVVPDDQLLEESMKLAREIATIDPVAIGLTKKAINRTYEVQGFREAIQANLDLDIHIETAETPERVEFGRILREEGLKAALIWREERFAAAYSTEKGS